MQVVVFLSGEGTNLQALVDADIDVALVVSDREDANGIQRAIEHHIPTLTINSFKPREAYDLEVVKRVKEIVTPDLIMFAGYMRIVSNAFINGMSCRIINLHPSLPGGLKGLNAIRRGYDQFIASNDNESYLGVMIHEVIESVDEGACILSRHVSCTRDDSFINFECRMHDTEHLIIVEAVKKINHGDL